MSAIDDAMNGRLSQILNMGSTANQYAAQGAQKRQVLQQQTQMDAYQKQMAAAQAAMAAQQQAALKSQQQQYSKQYQALLTQVGQNAFTPSSGTSGKANSSASGTYQVPGKGAKGNNFQSFLQAISGQESGGNYGAVNSSSGALGKYQVMPGNVANWSRAALGHSISVQEFLHNPALQEKVAQHELQRLYNNYGAAGAAVGWYAGEGTAQKYVKNGGRGYDAPQHGYPSINSYALSILHKMGMR